MDKNEFTAETVRPSARPASVEAATQKGQAELREIIGNILGTYAATYHKIGNKVDTERYIDLLIKRISDQGSAIHAPQTDSAIQQSKLSSAVAELVGAAAQVENHFGSKCHGDTWCNEYDDPCLRRLRSALEGVEKANRPTDGNTNSTD